MEAVQCFIDVRGNYCLQNYCNVLGSDFATFAGTESQEISFSEMMEHCTNFIGRTPIMGRLFGPLRLTYGAVKVPLSALAATFAVISSGVVLPFSKKQSVRCLYGALFFAIHSLNGVKNMGRGVVETIPIIGCYQFVVYDQQRMMQKPPLRVNFG